MALLVFGPKKLPELGKGIGDGIRGFKSAMKDNQGEKRVTSIPKKKAGTPCLRVSVRKCGIPRNRAATGFIVYRRSAVM